jgi:hypothetical protein
MGFDWEKYRRPDQTIDLLSAWKDLMRNEYVPHKMVVRTFIRRIEQYQPIRSRQVAATVLGMAEMIGNHMEAQ